MTAAGAVLSDTLLTEQLILGVNNFRKGVTAPADGTLGTTPTVPTILFALAAERLAAGALMPFNWDRSVDVDLILVWALAAVETNLDTLDVVVNYTVPTLAGGAGPAKVSTQVTGQITAVTGRLAIGDVYSMTIPLNRNDATNPYVSVGLGFAFEFGLSNILQIGTAHFLGGCVAYERSH